MSAAFKYLSVCSGIEAATVAWHPLGWSPVAFAQYDPTHKYKSGPDFPSAVLAHHFPDVPNLGDITKFKEWPDADVDVLVGGTPCQSFSVAGLRQGLADPRGNLALTYLGIVDRYRPKWFVWENVPGVLSVDGGRAFGSFLGGLAQLGYGFAYRIVDAQFVRVDGFGRAVPQRRRRVFVVGYLGSWRRAAAVLFEREGLSWDPAPRRKTGETVAPTISARPSGGGGLGADFDCDGGLVARTLSASRGAACANAEDLEAYIPVSVAGTLNANGKAAGSATQQDAECGLLVAHSLRGEGFDASEDGTGRGTPLVPICFDSKASGRNGFGVGSIASTLRSMGGDSARGNGGGQLAVAFSVSENANGFAWESDINPSLQARAQSETSNQFNGIRQGWAVRRLIPRECERLQGFPENYTDIPWRKKPGAPDGPRYKALGNSMAVNAMRWLGRRIQMISEVAK